MESGTGEINEKMVKSSPIRTGAVTLDQVRVTYPQLPYEQPAPDESSYMQVRIPT